MKICFWGDISGALKGKTTGGGELQVALLAKALALNGNEVFIVDPFTKEGFTTSEGVTVITVPGWNDGIRGIRLFKHRIPALSTALKSVKADFYYVRMRSYFNYLSYKAAKKVGARFIMAIASDLDLLGFSLKFRYSYKPHFNLYKLLAVQIPSDVIFSFLARRADILLRQHRGQTIDHLRLKGKTAIFPNVIETFTPIIQVKDKQDYFVFAGTINMLKGADKLLELLGKLEKKCKLIIIGQARDSKSQEIYTSLAKFENVTLKGRLPHSETRELIAGSKALISTSYFEGFPNVFLEAWASGVPVISLNVNPGGIIQENQLGIFCNGSLESMQKSMEEFDPASFDEARIMSYVNENHDFGQMGKRFMKIINF
ncbi:MAG: glycosyltransferase family 4 protein [Bacteroidetes bacterium]|nr:glycosyltransferase family 4 protein [Bacteroidota bacterium]